MALPETLVGRSSAMIEVFKEVGRVARTEMTVLLMGESGTGKELVARAVHSNSARSTGPFITVNMAALPRDLIESELYGHEKGSFTGAVDRRPGKFELASGGTLFLDEIGELPIELQAKLLRVLQEREIDRVGGSRALPVDVRVVAATNADLARSVEEGRFRRDLYYRLAVVPVRLPPLREREADVVLLARHFLARYGQQLKGRAVALGKDAEALLLSHPWPGNVRELQNVIQRALLKLNGPRLGAADLTGLLPAAAAAERGLSGLVNAMLDGSEPEGGRYQAAIEAVERPLIAAAIARTKGQPAASRRAAGHEPEHLAGADAGARDEGPLGLRSHQGRLPAVRTPAHLSRTSLLDFQALSRHGSLCGLGFPGSGPKQNTARRVLTIRVATPSLKPEKEPRWRTSPRSRSWSWPRRRRPPTST